MAVTNPATTYTLPDFVSDGITDEQTYKNFSITRNTLDAQFVDIDLIDYYIDELKAISIKVTKFTPDEIAEYKYHPDLLAYYLYGSTQLDFVLMLVNGIIDPKDFDFKRGYILVPHKDAIKVFLSEIYNAERAWIATRDK